MLYFIFPRFDNLSSNALSLTQDREPRTHLVGSKLAFIEKKVEELDIVVSKLVRPSDIARRP